MTTSGRVTIRSPRSQCTYISTSSRISSSCSCVARGCLLPRADRCRIGGKSRTKRNFVLTRSVEKRRGSRASGSPTCSGNSAPQRSSSDSDKNRCSGISSRITASQSRSPRYWPSCGHSVRPSVKNWSGASGIKCHRSFVRRGALPAGCFSRSGTSPIGWCSRMRRTCRRICESSTPPRGDSLSHGLAVSRTIRSLPPSDEQKTPSQD